MPAPLPLNQPHALFDVAATRRIEQAAAAALPPHTLMQRAGRAVARRDGQVLTLQLARGANPDISRLRVSPPRWLKSAELRPGVLVLTETVYCAGACASPVMVTVASSEKALSV